MNAGRLVWSRKETEGWYCYSIDEQFLYTATRFEERWWKVKYRQRVLNNSHRYVWEERVQIGSPASTLKLAKRLADEHHHAHIRKNGSLEHHDYILRFPLKELTR